ncbi:Lsr2 family protein [Streptomyces sp. ISL-12]|uniref:Lsr2 family protein n=1 Tax=Streptomyces sp. ISL-12 TaxID=2819177 RepID=UPI00203561F0|nr:Lsr2 family protein [Streptomyces sp. ISL-12]
MPVNAFTATAASMLTSGDSPEHVRTTLGLSKDELTEAVRHADTAAPAALSEPPLDDSPGAPEASAVATTSGSTVGTADTGGIEALLVWADRHPAAGVRNRAARVRSDLTELTERRSADAAQQRAEERVAKAKADQDAAQAQLRAVKTGPRAATADQDAALLVPAGAPAARSGKRSREELAAVRVWARDNGHQIANRGTPPRAVLDAYDAAHRTTDGAEAS